MCDRCVLIMPYNTLQLKSILTQMNSHTIHSLWFYTENDENIQLKNVQMQTICIRANDKFTIIHYKFQRHSHCYWKMCKYASKWHLMEIDFFSLRKKCYCLQQSVFFSDLWLKNFHVFLDIWSLYNEHCTFQHLKPCNEIEILNSSKSLKTDKLKKKVERNL